MRSLCAYTWPAEATPSEHFRLRVDGREVFVHGFEVCSFAVFSLAGPAECEIEAAFGFERAVVRPLSRRIEAQVEGRSIRLALDGPAYLSVELDGDLTRPLLLFAAPPEEKRPDPDDPSVRFFGAGRVHEPGLIELAGGETLYIEGGAVVRGAVVAQEAEGVRICGRGILDGTGWREAQERHRMVRLTACRDVAVEGITILNSPSWTIMPVGCDEVAVRHVKVITVPIGGDGVDLVGCRDAVVEDCFLRCNDDCVAVKAFDHRHAAGGRSIRDVLVQRCVLWNARGGNALEIGYETRCDEIRDVTFRDLDVIHAEHEGWQSGGVLTIHDGDRAEVHDILYEDIRVEDARQKLIDLKVLKARYSREDQPGSIHGVTVRNVAVVDGPFPVSIVRGYEGRDRQTSVIRDVTVENLTVHGRRITGALEAHMVVEIARDIRFA